MALFPRSLFITKLEGGSGCNAVSGELSIGAQGFYCENGEVIHPVEGLTLSTNFFDLLKNIVAVGSEYDDRYSTIQVPALAVSSISVSN
jgi:PmbA protein